MVVGDRGRREWRPEPGLDLGIEHLLVDPRVRLDALVEEGDEVGDHREPRGGVERRQLPGRHAKRVGPGAKLVVTLDELLLRGHGTSVPAAAAGVIGGAAYWPCGLPARALSAGGSRAP